MAIKSDVAREYRAKYPDMPSLALARVMLKREKPLFKDVENARSILRTIEGKSGAVNRKNLKDKTLVKKEARPYNPYKLPESHAEGRKTFKLPAANNNILVISDLHMPYHNVDAITLALEYGKKKKVNTIFINGDLIDFHQISRFLSDPRKRSVSEELETCRQFLATLRKTFPKADIYWLKGNHDVRLEHYLRAKAPELLGVDDFELRNLLRLAETKVHILDDKTLVKMGKLAVTHGHLLLRGVFAPVNSARGVFTRANQSTLISHVHKVSEHQETNMDGKVTVCYSIGCLCELSPDYNPLASKYMHGFAHVTTTKDDWYKVRNIKILEGKIL